MAGKGEIYKRADDKWSFRVKSSNGDTVATDGGQGYSVRADARATLTKLLAGGYDGPVAIVATLACGQEITKDTKLDGDLICPTGPALVITADNVTLDLGGYTVTGTPGASGEGPGIVFKNVKGSTVRNGTVQHFDAGVVIRGGSGNVVQDVTVRDNIGVLGGDFGDGIAVINSSKNRIQGNTVLRNGPYSGISLIEKSQENLIRGNIVTDNNMSHIADPSAGRQSMGIRIEGPEANKNRVLSNTVAGSGADGISVHATCTNPDAVPECVGSPPNEGNEITKNTSNGNGRSGRGSGVHLFSPASAVAPVRNTILDNTADNNKTYGISVDAGGGNSGSKENTIIRNRAHGNGLHDGHDGNVNPPCDANRWESNNFGTVSQPCLRVSPSGAASEGDEPE